MKRQILVCIAAFAAAPAASAADVQTASQSVVPVSSSAPSDWTVELGVEGRLAPAFEGSKVYQLWPYPIISIRRAGTTRNFTSPRDGFSFAIVDLGQFRFGPTAKVALPRDESDDPGALRGLGDVPWKIEIGAFAEFWPMPWLRTRGELRQGLSGHHGLIGELTADVVVPATQQLTLSAGPRLTFASAKALQPYFGITQAQSLASGDPIYKPGGGTEAVGAGAQARWQWNPQWATNVFVEYDHLLDGAANSPIVTRSGSRDQVTVGLGLSYTFNVALGF
jgi:outer membrane protein